MNGAYYVVDLSREILVSSTAVVERERRMMNRCHEQRDTKKKRLNARGRSEIVYSHVRYVSTCTS